jgi:hypothetical protein
VRQKKALEGLRKALTGINIRNAAELYMRGGTRMAAAVAVSPPLALRAALTARHAAAKHTSTRARL